MPSATKLGDIPEFGLGVKFQTLTDTGAPKVDLGPLTKLQGTWEGIGFNLISVPGPKPDGFTFEVIPYKEKMTFTPVVAAGNRGPVVATGQVDQQLAGLMYEQVVISTCNTDLCKKMGFARGTEIHAERGIFLWAKNFNSGFDISRLSTIPHGNSVLALGRVFEGAPPNNNFPLTPPVPSPLPKTVTGQPVLDYGLDQFNKQQFPGFDQLNPNSILVKDLNGKKITDMTTLILSTENGKNGGGILNIPFIQQNADATLMDSIFWIETIEGQKELQLQYSQTIDLVFPPTGTLTPIVWPHITVATMKQTSKG